jgi:hypothetical protein
MIGSMGRLAGLLAWRAETGEGGTMGRLRGPGTVAAVVCSAVVGGTAFMVAGAAVAARSGGGWRKAERVPGISALERRDGGSWLQSVSCPRAGSCVAGGYYLDRAGGLQAFIVTERDGRWGKAIPVPGIGALDRGQNAQVSSVSCSSAGDCALAGTYAPGTGPPAEGFVASEKNGHWGKAREVPGLGALNKLGAVAVLSISCRSAGDCAIGGDYVDAAGHTQAFVAVQRAGRWEKAEEVPGTARVNAGGDAFVNSVSCGAASSCTAVGVYTDNTNHTHTFVLAERDGRWASARQVPGTETYGNDAWADSVSCPKAGDCAAGGYDAGAQVFSEAFVAAETNGRWGAAEQVPGIAGLNVGGQAQVTSLSCASAGNCAAGGTYSVPGSTDVFVATERNGRWGKAEEVPGTAALNTGHEADVVAVSCGSAGSCSAAGTYETRSTILPFVVSERNGRWGKAEEIPGTAALGRSATALALSCASASSCVAGGYYVDRSRLAQAFVVSRT